jgi:hypothetical protein
MMADQAVELKEKLEDRLIALQTNTVSPVHGWVFGFQDETKRIGEASNYSS